MARPPLFGNGWLKAAGLALVASPLFTPMIVPHGRDAGDALRVMLELGAYSALVWAMIAAFSGLDTLAEYLSVGFFFGVTTAILTGLVAALTKLLPSLGLGAPTDLQILRTFLTTAVGVPLALFAVQCFPVGKILQRLHSGRRSSYDSRVAVVLRVFQHLAEVFPRLAFAWREECPQLWLPRHRLDWTANPLALAQFWDWMLRAAMLWSRALLMHCMRIVPVVTAEVGRYDQVTRGGANE